MRLRRKKYQLQPAQPLPLSGGWPSAPKSALLVLALICLLAPSGAQAISLRQTVHSVMKQTTAGELSETTSSLQNVEELSSNELGLVQQEELHQKTLSQETIEAAATQATEEAVAEAQNAMLAQAQSAEADSEVTSIAGQGSLLRSLQQEAEAVSSGTFEGLVDQNLMEQGAQQGSAVDTTLDELKKLRIIDQELAKAQNEQKSDPNSINEQVIESSTLAQMQGQKKDSGHIENLVQQQIQDQVTKIDSAQALQGSLDTLEYAANIETKDFLQEDKQEPKAAPVVQPTPAPKPQAPAEDFAPAQVQAAMSVVAPKVTATKTAVKLPEAPLMPSKDASETSLDATFSYKKKKPIKPTVFQASAPKKTPEEERKLLDALISKSVELGRKKANASVPTKKVESTPAQEKGMMANDLFKAKANQVQKKTVAPTPMTTEATLPNKNQVPMKTQDPSPKKEKTKVAISANKPISEKPKTVSTIAKHEEKTLNKTIASSKEQSPHHVEIAAHKKHSKHHKGHKHHKSYDELVQENEQLDNLFLTVRDDLLKEPASHTKKPSSSTLVQLVHKSRQKQKSKSKDDDQSVDEQAEATLKSMAHSMTTESKKESDSFKSPAEVSMVLSTQKQESSDSSASNSAAKRLVEGTEVDAMMDKAESKEPEHQLPVHDTGSDNVPGGKKGDSTIAKLLEEDETEKALVKAENHAADNGATTAPADVQEPASEQPKEKKHEQKDSAIKKLLEESETEDSLKKAESSESVSGAPEEDSFLQVEAQVQAQVQATVQARAQATAQAAAASKALAAMGVQQKAQVSAQDQNLIDTLKQTIGQLEMKKNPALAVAAAKKKAVTNIQKALTKKILTRLDDSQPIVNVFSKMQSLSKMMPAIQDFERRLGILHQVEPILESAIGTLSKVVDMSSPIPSMPKAIAPVAPPPPPPAPVAPAGPDLNQLKSLLAQAEAAQGQGGGLGPVAAAPADDGGLAGLLGGLGGGAPAAAPSGLEALLGGGEEEAAAPQPAMVAPAFLQAAAAAPAAAPAEADGGEAALLSRLLGSSLVELDSDLNTQQKSQM